MNRTSALSRVLILAFVVSPSIATAADDPRHVANHNAWVQSFQETEHAWPLYLEVLRRCPALVAADHHSAIEAITELRPGDSDWSASVAFVREYQEALTLLREAASRKIIGVPWSDVPPAEILELLGEEPREPAKDPLLVDLTFSELSHFRDFTAILALDARVAAEDNDAHRMLSNLVALLGFAKQLQRDPDRPIIQQLVAYSVLRHAIDTTFDLLTSQPALFDDEALTILARTMMELDLRLSTRFERLSIEDVLARAYTDDGEGTLSETGLHLLLRLSGADDLPAPGTPELKNRHAIMSPLFVSYKQASEAADELWGLYEADLQNPLWLWTDSQYSLRSDELFGDEDGPRYGFVSIMLPAFHKPYTYQEGTIHRRDAALVVIAIHRAQLAAGEWPDTLDALVPQYLAELPRDRYSGAPFGYQLGPDGPTLYSVGVDLDDDNGAPPSNESDPKSVWIIRKSRDGEAPDGDWILFPPQPQ